MNNNIKICQSLIHSILESTTEGILFVGVDRSLSQYNNKFIKMWEIPDSIIKSKDDRMAVACVAQQLADPQEFVAGLQRLYTNPRADCFDELHFHDGRVFQRYSVPHMIDKKIIGRIFSFKDITKNHNFLLHTEPYDPITGLPTKMLLLDRVNQGLHYARKYHESLAFLFLGLKNYREIKATIGSDLIDLLLRMISERLEKCIGEFDTLARWNEDEFVIALKNIKGREEIVPVLRRCMFAMENSFALHSHHIKVNFSLGITVFPEDGETPSTLLKHANLAMLHSQSSHGSSIKFYNGTFSFEY